MLLIMAAGCANIVPPDGGKKDITPPKLLAVKPGDSLLNTRVSRIDFRFDEFITLNEANTQIQIAPLLQGNLTITNTLKTVTIKIPDSLLQAHTTYRIALGTAIRDLHEGNVFAGYTYTFSTCSYFDSLAMAGQVTDAATGMPDTLGRILLYDAQEPDSVVLRKKPLYVAVLTQNGTFRIDGLPEQNFKIFYLSDKNDNLMWDPDQEKIAFTDAILRPKKDSVLSVALRSYMEIKDTIRADAPALQANQRGGSKKMTANAAANKAEVAYTVAVDTADAAKRTQDITLPLAIHFSQPPKNIFPEKISLTIDTGMLVAQPFTLQQDTAQPGLLKIQPVWQENQLYTLRLIKGFAQDSAGADLMPATYTFRSKRAEDYASLQIHVPSAYYGNRYLLQVLHEKNTIYQKPITDTIVHFNRLEPGTYTIRVIQDDNQNGQWDKGRIFEKKQPEFVFPNKSTIFLKSGWDNILDFNYEKPADKPEQMKNKSLGAASSKPDKE